VQEAAHKEFGPLLRAADGAPRARLRVIPFVDLGIQGATARHRSTKLIVRVLRPDLFSLSGADKPTKRQISPCFSHLGLLHEPKQGRGLEGGHLSEIHVKDLSFLRGEVHIVRSHLLLIDESLELICLACQRFLRLEGVRHFERVH